MGVFKQLETFVSVVNLGSLSAAARQEDVVPAIIGRRLDALEHRLGVKLLVRTTRSISLTQEVERRLARWLGVPQTLLFGSVTLANVGHELAFTPKNSFSLWSTYDITPKITLGGGIRLGTPAVTTRGMKEAEMKIIADWITRALADPSNEAELAAIRAEVHEVNQRFPLP